MLRPRNQIIDSYRVESRKVTVQLTRAVYTDGHRTLWGDKYGFTVNIDGGDCWSHDATFNSREVAIDAAHDLIQQHT